MTLKELPVGSIVTDRKTKFNNRPIEWLVADHAKYPGGTVLLSKDIICCRPFDTPKKSYVDEGRRKFGLNRWSESDIREWLENEIWGKSFSKRLADLAIPILNVTELSECDKKFYGSDGVVDNTEDHVFLLSEDEVGYAGDHKALELFKSDDRDKDRIAEACPGLPWYWWLRSPYAGNSHCARFVCADGSLGFSTAYNSSNGVRPACVIKSSAPVKKKKTGSYEFY